MGKSEPTESRRRGELTISVTVPNEVIGTLTAEDGTQTKVTGAEFLELIQKSTDEDDQDIESQKKLKAIIDSFLEYGKNNPGEFRKSFSPETIKSLLLLQNFLFWKLEATTEEGQAEEAEGVEIPKVKSTGVNKYVATKDILTKAVFGEPGRNGKTPSIVSKRPGFLTLWTSNDKKSKKDVVIYTQLEINEKALEKAGITIGRNLSSGAREVYGAMLSHYLAGNRILTTRMLAKIIYNVSDHAQLTKKQEKYIIDGVKEVFLTTLYIDTTHEIEEKNAEKWENLLTKCNVKLVSSDQLFPGSFTAAYINGNLVKDAIVLRDLPALYKLQNQLERGQILKVPIDYMEIPGRIDEDLVAIRAYLLRRIDAMKHSSGLSQMIIFKNILSEVGIDPTDRKQRNKTKPAKERTERILNHWKTQGYIKNFHELDWYGKPAKQNGSIYEIKIDI